MKIIEKYYRWRAKRRLISKYLLDTAVEEILKDWITDCIVDRKQEHRRKELVETQNQITESKLFIKWLRKR